ncbi:MAG: tRNA glutamyl-Q(34) synthetase GluQRS [Candidatus Marinimicrobia bacterium]|nr:tRNA glutamyl-Q(34) synthetase GluQRS [Candidatus Neomarinimicrobiota bacterium]
MKSINPAHTTRFAPSPTGYLHIGHAFSAMDAASAATDQGRLLLRIEDTDKGRCKAVFEDAIYEDLAWLGLGWELPVRRQSEHFDDYQSALKDLDRLGLLYPCFCTRAQILREIENSALAPHQHMNGPNGPVYPGTCRQLAKAEQKRRIRNGEPNAIRLRTDVALKGTGALTWTDELRGEVNATPEIFGDVILARKDTLVSYHLACTWDDALQGVTLVTRGEDLFPSTHLHRLLQALLNLPTPSYRHHSLLIGKDGKKFSKRNQSFTLRCLRSLGWTKQQVISEFDHLKAWHL